MAKKYHVKLSMEERERLVRIASTGKGSARVMRWARMLLKADEGEHGEAWTDERIGEALNVGLVTVYRLRQRFVMEGLEAALTPPPGPNKGHTKLDGRQEAHLIALVCGEPPQEQGRWTLRLLADKMVELGHTDTLSHETVRQTLKKTSLNPGKQKAGASPGQDPSKRRRSS